MLAIPHYENSFGRFTVVYLVCPLLAVSYCLYFSSAINLAYPASLSVDWLYTRDGVQIYWGGAHATLSDFQGSYCLIGLNNLCKLPVHISLP